MKKIQYVKLIQPCGNYTVGSVMHVPEEQEGSYQGISVSPEGNFPARWPKEKCKIVYSNENNA